MSGRKGRWRLFGGRGRSKKEMMQRVRMGREWDDEFGDVKMQYDSVHSTRWNALVPW